MSTDLSGAVRAPRTDRNFVKTEIVTSTGVFKGYFIGIGEKHEQAEPCGKCQGTGLIRNETCRTCKGEGTYAKTLVPLLWKLGPELIQKEWVNYIISPAGTKNGKPTSPSTLWLRMRMLSGGLTDESQIQQWYAALGSPIKIPIEMTILENDFGKLHIAQVKLRQLQAPTPAVAPEPSDYALFDDDERR